MFQISLKLKLRRAARPTVDGRSRQLVKSASVLLKLADCFQPSIASTGSTLIDPVPPFALPLPATAKRLLPFAARAPFQMPMGQCSTGSDSLSSARPQNAEGLAEPVPVSS